MGVWTSDQGGNASVRDALTLDRTLCVTQDVELQEGRGAANKVMGVGSTPDRFLSDWVSHAGLDP